MANTDVLLVIGGLQNTAGATMPSIPEGSFAEYAYDCDVSLAERMQFQGYAFEAISGTSLLPGIELVRISHNSSTNMSAGEKYSYQLPLRVDMQYYSPTSKAIYIYYSPPGGGWLPVVQNLNISSLPSVLTVSNYTAQATGVESGAGATNDFLLISISINKAALPSVTTAAAPVTYLATMGGAVGEIDTQRATRVVSPQLPIWVDGTSWELGRLFPLGGAHFVMSYGLRESPAACYINTSLVGHTLTVEVFSIPGVGYSATIDYNVDFVGYWFIGPSTQDIGLLLYIDTTLLRLSANVAGTSTKYMYVAGALQHYAPNVYAADYAYGYALYPYYLYNRTADPKLVSITHVASSAGSPLSTDYGKFALSGDSLTDPALTHTLLGGGATIQSPGQRLSGTIPPYSYRALSMLLDLGASVPADGVQGTNSLSVRCA